MKLHLHLGAHKTATTHFQNVMESNRNLYEKNTHYVSMDEFRVNVTQAGKLINPRYNSEVDEYLEKLKETKKQRLVISEENIIGESQDIYCSKLLYSNVEKRVNRLKGFVAKFSEANIWISIRSMDTFIPSLYCESLLHSKFRRFGLVFSGQYAQSWVPVISILRETFPGAKINVISYDTYRTILPKWLTVITGVKAGWNLLEEERPRASLNYLALKIMNYAHLFIPPAKSSVILEAMSWYFYKRGKGNKFSPFKGEIKSSLKILYMEDLEKIKNLCGNIYLFKI
jgi:hypothetical protein